MSEHTNESADFTRCLLCGEAVHLILTARHTEDRHKAAEPCSTFGCPGDGRYAAPGRGHVPGCEYPLSSPPGEGAAR